MTDDPYTQSLLATGGRSAQKRKQRTFDPYMEPQKSASFFWNRKKQTFPGDTHKRPKAICTACMHEHISEHEGFPPPDQPARPGKPAHSHTSSLDHFSHVKTSEDLGCASPSASRAQPRQSFSGVNNPTGTSLLNASKRPKKSILSFGRFIDGQSQDSLYHGRPRLSMLSEHDPIIRTPSFLRRYMSSKTHGRPQTPSMPVPSYKEPSPRSFHLPAPVPEFGLLPGFGFEPSKPPTDLSSGAAARAAAAAQNEILATMRSLSLAEPKINRDSESGVGIEIRESTEETTGSEVPVVRQGNCSALL